MCKPVSAVLVLTAHCSLSGISAASSSRAQNKRNAHDNKKETPSKLVHTTVSPWLGGACVIRHFPHKNGERLVIDFDLFEESTVIRTIEL